MPYYHNKKKIGTLKNGTFSKNIKGSKHFFRMYDAIGLDLTILKNPDIQTLKATDTETGITYTASKDTFREHGIKGNYQTPQVFLPRKYWNTENAKQKQLI